MEYLDGQTVKHTIGARPIELGMLLSTGDAVFDGTLKQALAVQLEQAPFLNVLSQARVRETLGFYWAFPR